MSERGVLESRYLLPELPAEIDALAELATDLRWTWSHEADRLWLRANREIWTQTGNPWIILQDCSSSRLRQLADDETFVRELDRLAKARRAYLDAPTWFSSNYEQGKLRRVAFFSMEFGLGQALPLYAGGLGVLAGDFLKTASDLGVPVVGVGLLYQEGYFRQMVDAAGHQNELYPFNEPESMPVRPVLDRGGGWAHVSLDLPGRKLLLRIWQAIVGRTTLYLLDSNDPLNSPVDRGITGKLYDDASENRLLQEIVLGIGGWRAVETLCPDIEVCHLNEGHSAFVVIARACDMARRHALTFREAFWGSRAGNVFTSHTPVESGFDQYSPQLVRKYLIHKGGPTTGVELDPDDLVGLGQTDLSNPAAPFNMAYLALRGSLSSFGVSRLHGAVSRRIFQPLFPRWPRREVPVAHITNGVHVPSWDAAGADRVWTNACGKERWRSQPDQLCSQIEKVSDETLWMMRAENRKYLVDRARARLAMQLAWRGSPPETVDQAEGVLDPNVLTLGLARRFTAYKRPNLLLHDRDRLKRLLLDDAHPVQLIVAGKAHPKDEEGKRMIERWLAFAHEPALRHRVVFLEDYDIKLAQEIVQGVDLWINTPRRPWEACGTSGMKILVNGGLNLSERDGWWEEAYDPEVGWAIGNGREHTEPWWDAHEADELYTVLEREVVPLFYDRDARSIPRGWLARVRKSMSILTPHYSGTRMIHEYLERAYLPAAALMRERLDKGAVRARALAAWERRVMQHWAELHIGAPNVVESQDQHAFSVPVYLSALDVDDVRVELYAEPVTGEMPDIVALTQCEPIPGATNGYIYRAQVAGDRNPADYTVRIVPDCPGARVPVELPLILWQK